VCTDIAPINARAAERLGYPTQKPLALLERIIEVSSNAGGVVGSQLIWRLRVRSGGAYGGFSFDVARRRQWLSCASESSLGCVP
jgi:hypothetical protein